jgi:hypothetical protein
MNVSGIHEHEYQNNIEIDKTLYSECFENIIIDLLSLYDIIIYILFYFI